MKENTMIKLKQKLHGNSIVKRTVTVTPQNEDTIKKVIETFFASGKITTEEIQIFSIKKTFFEH